MINLSYQLVAFSSYSCLSIKLTARDSFVIYDLYCVMIAKSSRFGA